MTEEEFAELYNRLQRHVFRYAVTHLRAAEQAHDAVSETFRIAWEKRKLIKSEARSATAYVMGISKFVVLRQIQDRQRHPEDVYEDDRLDALVPAVRDVSESVIDAHRGRSIHEHLTPSEQRLIGLMMSPHLDAAEIAEILGLSRNAYAVRVHRVRRRIEELSHQFDHVMEPEGGAP